MGNVIVYNQKKKERNVIVYIFALSLFLSHSFRFIRAIYAIVLNVSFLIHEPRSLHLQYHFLSLRFLSLSDSLNLATDRVLASIET